MPKFMKQVRNFLNNSPFKMYGAKPTPAKFNASLKKASASGKLNGSPKFKAAVDASSAMKMYKKSAPLKVKGNPKENEQTIPKADPYAKAAKKDSKLGEYVAKRKTLKKGSAEWNANQNKINKAYGVKKRYNEASATKPANDVSASATKPANDVSGRIDNSVDAIKKRAQVSQNKKALAPTGKRVATTTPETIKKVTKEELAANAKRTKNKMIADKAKAAMDKKKAAAAGQKQNMKDKIKLKEEIKDKRKSTTRKERKQDVKYQDKDTGKNVSAQDQLKAKRQAKRKKGQAIRKYKKDPNALKVAKVKKDKNSPAKKYTSNAQRKAVHASKAEKNSAMKMYKSTKSPAKMKNKNSPAKNYKKGYYGIK